MERNKPFIYLFKTPGAHYVYDVNTNRILNVKKNIYDILAKTQTADAAPEDLEHIEAMKQNGFLASNRIEEIMHPVTPQIEYLLNNGLTMLTLQITQNCNLRCEYCLYSPNYINRTHNNQRMTFETAKKGIDFLINRSLDSQTISIGFYGGEPLLEYDLIKKCVAYTKEQGEGKKLLFSMTTNATLLDDEKIAFLMENDFNIMISLDGPEEVHNRHRKFAVSGCGSFETVTNNLKVIKQKYPEFYKKIGFIAVLDQANDFGCLNTFFTDTSIFEDNTFRFSEISDDNLLTDKFRATEDFKIKRDYEIFKIYLNKLGRMDDKYISPIVNEYYIQIKQKIHRDRRPELKAPRIAHHGGPCIPGVLRLFMSADGTFYPCERVSETSTMMRIGHIDTGFDVEKVRTLLNIGKLTASDCKKCWAYRFCYLCAGYADKEDHLSADKKISRCKEVRTDAATSLLEYCTLREFGHNFDDEF